MMVGRLYASKDFRLFKKLMQGYEFKCIITIDCLIHMMGEFAECLI